MNTALRITPDPDEHAGSPTPRASEGRDGPAEPRPHRRPAVLDEGPIWPLAEAGDHACSVQANAFQEKFKWPGDHRQSLRKAATKLTAGIASDDNNHLITPEERLRVAMAKQ